MKIISRIISYIALLVFAAGLVMTIDLMFSSALRADEDSVANILLNYGCMLKAASVYALIGSIAVIILGSVINYRQLDISEKLSVSQIIWNSLKFEKSSVLVLFLYSVSQLLLAVFIYGRLSYIWSHCA